MDELFLRDCKKIFVLYPLNDEATNASFCCPYDIFLAMVTFNSLPLFSELFDSAQTVVNPQRKQPALKTRCRRYKLVI